MSDKVHIPEHQWSKQKRRQRFKNKKQRHKNIDRRQSDDSDNFDDENIDIKKWRDEWRNENLP